MSALRPPAPRRRPGHVGLDELAARCGIHPELLRRFLALGLVEADDPETADARGRADARSRADARAEAPSFPPHAAVRVQRIVRIRRELGVNYAGVGIVLDLLERIEVLEARLRRHEGASSRRGGA